MYIYYILICIKWNHFTIHLKLTQHCILTILQLKSFIKKIKGGKVKGSEFAFVNRGWGEMERKSPPRPFSG